MKNADLGGRRMVRSGRQTIRLSGTAPASRSGADGDDESADGVESKSS